MRTTIILTAVLISYQAVAALNPQQQEQLNIPQTQPYETFQYQQGNGLGQGMMEFAGWGPCNEVAGSQAYFDFCVGPNHTELTSHTFIDAASCEGLLNQAAMAAGGAGTGVNGKCGSVTSSWNLSSQCSPFVDLGVTLTVCAFEAFGCSSQTFLGIPLHARCCPVGGPVSECFP